MNKYHVPVLLKQSVDALCVKENGVYVDATFGGGGHSKEILKSIKGGKLYAFDKDEDAQKNNFFDERFKLFKSDYKYIHHYLKKNDVDKIDGLIADLGVSSHQINNKNRGFSYKTDSKLDMRMNQKSKISAYDVVNTYSKIDLDRILKNYGDFSFKNEISSKIINYRKTKMIKSTAELANVVLADDQLNKKNSKYLSRIFQSIRIEVNNELDSLKSMLCSSLDFLKTSARIVIISYHSAEDRIVKNWFKRNNFDGELKKDIYGKSYLNFKEVNKKVIQPSLNEINKNKRSRSAKMRVAIKT